MSQHDVHVVGGCEVSLSDLLLDVLTDLAFKRQTIKGARFQRRMN